MHTIKTRADINLLVITSYAKIRTDALLAPIFNKNISEGKWPEHLEKLTDFWETNLFGIPKYKGSPSKKHVGVDAKMGHTISQVHFGKWLELWFETVDALYEGDLAFKAKNAARKMATGQYLAIWESRP